MMRIERGGGGRGALCGLPSRPPPSFIVWSCLPISQLQLEAPTVLRTEYCVKKGEEKKHYKLNRNRFASPRNLVYPNVYPIYPYATNPPPPPRANTTSVYVVVPPPRRRDAAILLLTDNKVTLFCFCACRACPSPSERDPEKGLWDEGGLGTLVMSPSRYQPLASFPIAACYLTLLKCHGKLDDVAIRIRPLLPHCPPNATCTCS